MQHGLTEYLSKFISLSEAEAEFIRKNVPVRSYKKGSILLREVQIAQKCWFILKGCVRQYHLSDGQEKTTFFYTEEQAVVFSDSFEKQKPSGYFLVCSEDCTMTESILNDIPDSYDQFPKFEKISLILSGQYHSETKDLFASFVSSSPEERYLHLLSTRPGLLQRVPQHQIASFIGVTPESLSRIRKRLSARLNDG